MVNRILPGIFLNFFPYGTAVELLFSQFLAAILVALIRRSKRPQLAIPKVRNRLSFWTAVVRVVLGLIAFALLSQSTGETRTESLLGGQIDRNAQSIAIALLIGIPGRALIVFFMTTLGLKIGMMGIKYSPETAAANEVTQTVQENPPPMPSQQVVPRTPPQIQKPIFSPGARLQVALLVLLAIILMANAIAIYQNLSLLPVFAQSSNQREILSMMASPFRQIIGSVQLLAGVATIIIFLLWFHRAYLNLYVFKVKGLKFSPGWAIAWWFIPLMNLFMPYQVFNEIWKASDPRIQSDEPKIWKAPPCSRLMPFWWVFFLLSWVHIKISGSWITPETLKILNWIELGKNIAELFAAGLLILLVIETDRRQKAKNELGSFQTDASDVVFNEQTQQSNDAQVLYPHPIKKKTSGCVIALIVGLVVLIPLLVIVPLIAVNFLSYLDEAKVQTTKVQIKLTESSLEAYRRNHGSYPSQEQGLAALESRPTTGPIPENYPAGGYMKSLPKDAWGRAMIYESRDSNRYTIRSLGDDGIPGGEGSDEDITASSPE